jgi:hypothetical protein
VTLALSQWSTVAWWITLGAGLVVAVVVTLLLEVLRRSVVEVEASVEAVLRAGGAVAQNTQTTHLLNTTKARGVDVLTVLEPQPPTPGGGPPR